MILFALWGLALVATSIAVGRVYERIAADRRRDQEAEDARIQRPWVTVTDGGWADPDHVAVAITAKYSAKRSHADATTSALPSAPEPSGPAGTHPPTSSTPSSGPRGPRMSGPSWKER